MIEDLFGGDTELSVIAGPCVLESDEITFVTAERLKKLCDKLNLTLIFKSSYDKANRTSIDSFRGPGIEKGLEILSEVKKRSSLPVLTDVHSPDDARRAAQVVDVLQIPAFLCRQTDLIIAASETGISVNIKRGQFLAPWDVKNIIDKFISTGNKNLFITERGVSFGYNNLVVDYRSFPIMKSFGYPVVFDVTHSLQLPGGEGSSSGGQREFAETLARAAIAAGADGLFLEVHPEPEKAMCDGPNMIKLGDLESMITSLINIKRAISHG